VFVLVLAWWRAGELAWRAWANALDAPPCEVPECVLCALADTPRRAVVAHRPRTG